MNGDLRPRWSYATSLRTAPVDGARAVRIRTQRHMALWAALAGALAAGNAASAAIDVVFWPEVQTVQVGDTVGIGVYVVSDTSEPQSMSAAQVVFTWDPAVLQLIGLNDAGAVPLLASVFPAVNTAGYNEVVPPQDGDGTYVAWGNLGDPVLAQPEGTLLTTFEFTALATTAGTVVEPILAGGSTKVISGVVPGLVVTGELVGCVVEVVCSAVFADLNCDGIVDGADLGLLLADWGDSAGPADLNRDGIVDGADLGLLLASWT